jgi:general secretion pathway protein B
MSYILDALRRADAERERGAVPRLHSSNLAAPAGAAAAGSRTGASGSTGLFRYGVPAAAAVVALAAGAGVLVAGGWLDRGEPAAVPVAPAPGADASPREAPAAERLPGTLAVEPSPAADAAAAQPFPVTPPAPTVLVVPMPAPAPPPAAPPPRPRAAAPVAPPAGGEAPPVPVASLSAEQQRLWPTLSPGGSVYSNDASQRFVILNGQVLREGDTAAPGITVDAIGPRSVLLRWGGLRVELPL